MNPLILKMVMLVFPIVISQLEKQAVESKNEWDDIGIQILRAVYEAYKSGDLKI